MWQPAFFELCDFGVPWNSQVMECCWASLEKQVHEAEDLDQVIVAHHEFLEMIAAQCLLDTSADSKVHVVCCAYYVCDVGN